MSNNVEYCRILSNNVEYCRIMLILLDVCIEKSHVPFCKCIYNGNTMVKQHVWNIRDVMVSNRIAILAGLVRMGWCGSYDNLLKF